MVRKIARQFNTNLEVARKENKVNDQPLRKCLLQQCTIFYSISNYAVLFINYMCLNVKIIFNLLCDQCIVIFTDSLLTVSQTLHSRAR